MSDPNRLPPYIHCGTDGYGTLAEARAARLVKDDETHSYRVEIVDGTGLFTGNDPTDEQILETILAAGINLTENSGFFRLVCANTRQYYEALFALATAEVTGVGDMGKTGGLLPFRRVSSDAEEIGKLISFGGMDKAALKELNTTTLTKV